MEIAVLSVGDEILAGDTVNTNASWLADRIDERGGSVRRILTVPDDRGVIADTVREWAAAFDAVVVTGGIGGTPDDVTMEAVADGLDRDLAVDRDERARLEAKARQFREENPELAEDYDIDLDLDAAASLPEGSRALATDAGWAPGCVVENVYVLPGIPEEMKAMFELVGEEFGGDVVSQTLYTPEPEGALGDRLNEVRERFDASVGSYPGVGSTPGRLKVTGTDAETVAAATDWLRDHVEITDPPEGDADD
ncbi:competence/damage-inducible protein A [Halorussus aquaticus]|uniref:Competence/damage-inducible protein A n=1 Tax=Halorussus aquaticus TaxID=2953748 RepID=A0ABD5Q4F6_9EURY|nr:molybdopterin-binding protein [Halorussus aquaticus]